MAASGDEHGEGNGGRKASLPLRASNGWDGKLRVSRSGGGGGADEAFNGDGAAESGGEASDEDVSEAEEKAVAFQTASAAPQPHAIDRQPGEPPVEVVPGEEIDADEDLLEGVEEDETDIDLNHRRIASIPRLHLERFTSVVRLCLRQNELTSIHFPAAWVAAAALEELDLYDNKIAHVRGLDDLYGLTSLDLSFNNIKHIKHLDHLAKLRDLYFVQNKISKIEGLDALTALRQLELGGNRIREIENLGGLANLEELYLGKNKITELKNLSHLQNLKTLAVQSNRLTSPSLAHLSGLASLTDLYISHNLLDSLEPLASSRSLRVVDISWNPIASLKGLEPLEELEELWASRCKLDDFKAIEQVLGDKKNLDTVYLEGNPLELRQKVLYRNKVRLALPQVKQIDATFVRID